jgi:hypothetical protein
MDGLDRFAAARPLPGAQVDRTPRRSSVGASPQRFQTPGEFSTPIHSAESFRSDGISNKSLIVIGARVDELQAVLQLHYDSVQSSEHEEAR